MDSERTPFNTLTVKNTLSTIEPSVVLQKFVDTSVLPIEDSTFLVTDKLDNNSLPVFYYHKTSFDFRDVKIFDSLGREVLNALSIQEGKILTNLKNQEDIYFVHMSNDSSNTVELLNSKPIFNPATFEDFDEFANLDRTKNVYLILDNQNIQMSRHSTWYVKDLIDKNLVLSFKDVSIDTSWLPSIPNVSRLITGAANRQFVYRIAEFVSEQFFSPTYPYKTVLKQKAQFISPTIVQTANKKITNEFSIEVEVDGVLFDVVSVDEDNGFILLNQAISESQTVLVSYSYEEQDFVIDYFDFNPVFNPSLKTKQLYSF